MVPSTLNFARGSSSKKSESAMLTETFGTCFKNTCDHTSAAAYKTETKTFQRFICSKVRTLQMYTVKFETRWKTVHWTVLHYCTRLLDCEFQHIDLFHFVLNSTVCICSVKVLTGCLNAKPDVLNTY